MLILCNIRVTFDDRTTQVSDGVLRNSHLPLVHVLALVVTALVVIFVVVLLFFLAPETAPCIPCVNRVSARDWPFQR